MEKEIINEEYFYRLYDSDGNESDIIKDEATLKEKIKDGTFTVKVVTGWDCLGPSSWPIYRTEERKISKVVKCTWQTVLKKEEIDISKL